MKRKKRKHTSYRGLVAKLLAELNKARDSLDAAWEWADRSSIRARRAQQETWEAERRARDAQWRAEEAEQRARDAERRARDAEWRR